MRKFDCNSFRITGNTNFKKLCIEICLGKASYESELKATEICRHTAGAEAVGFQPFSERLL